LPCGGCEVAEWVGFSYCYREWTQGKDGGREEYHAFLGERFASLEG
jgi:hypothetical protein